jgi:hypothetical protein
VVFLPLENPTVLPNEATPVVALVCDMFIIGRRLFDHSFNSAVFLPVVAVLQRLFSLLVNPINSAIGWPLHTVFFVNGSSSWRSRSGILDRFVWITGVL